MAAKTQAAPVPPRLAPVVLIKGSESLLADRALSELRRLAHEVDPSFLREATKQANWTFSPHLLFSVKVG